MVRFKTILCEFTGLLTGDIGSLSGSYICLFSTMGSPSLFGKSRIRFSQGLELMAACTWRFFFSTKLAYAGFLNADPQTVVAEEKTTIDHIPNSFLIYAPLTDVYNS